MKNFFTKLFIVVAAMSLSIGASAQCADYTYFTANEHWSSSDFYKMIELKASDLTDASLPMTGADDGKSENGNYGTKTSKNPFGSGELQTPLYTFDEATSTFVPSDKTWPITYHNCVFAPNHYTSAYTKVEDYGETPSGKNNACTMNDNSSYVSKVYDMKGFIEMNRLCGYEGGFGYIQIDGLHNIEKVQWGYSSTSWKRGIKCDVRVDGEDWKAQRWLPSDLGNGTFAAFSEQGYEFEEGFDPDDETKFSIRWRVWDGDTTSFQPKSFYGDSIPVDHIWKPVSDTLTWQVPRIHMITIYSGIDGTAFLSSAPKIAMDVFTIRRVNNQIILSKECKVEVYSMDGKFILRGQGKSIDVADLRKGLYVIKAKANDGTLKNVKLAL